LKPFKPKFDTGTLAKYSRLISSASEGAIFKTKEADYHTSADLTGQAKSFSCDN